MATLYRVFREAGTLNTVTNTDGTTLTGQLLDLSDSSGSLMY